MPDSYTFIPSPAILTVRRKDIWDSRGAAATFIRRGKFYQNWTPEVVELYIVTKFKLLTKYRNTDYENFPAVAIQTRLDIR